jgi:hypothetical protein
VISKSLLGFRIASNEIKEKAMTSRKLPAEMRKSSADIPWNSFISNIHSTQGRDRLAHQFPVAFTLLDRLAEVAPDRPPKRLEQELEAHFRDGGVEAALHACKSWKQELAGVRCSSGRDGDGDSPWTFRRCSHGTETEIRGGGGSCRSSEIATDESYRIKAWFACSSRNDNRRGGCTELAVSAFRILFLPSSGCQSRRHDDTGQC